MSESMPVVDAHPPAEVAREIERIGVLKARTDALTLLVLALLAGAFISLGAILSTVAMTDSMLGFGPTRLLGGLAFSLGLVLVVVAGAELFTGNNLIAVAWASGRIGFQAVLRNWLLVYLGNVVGCLGTVALVYWAGIAELSGGAVGETALRVASAKTELSTLQALARGVLCNALVCLAVWLAVAARSVTDKIVAIIFPVTAFVALGFEHSIANWYFLPYGMLLDGQGSIAAGAVAHNLAVVTVGNLLGGTLLVAGVYWLAYLRGVGRAQGQP